MLTSQEKVMLISFSPWYYMMRRAHYLMAFVPKIHYLSPITRKHQTNQHWETLYKIPAATLFKKCQGHERQGNTKKFSHSGRDKRDMTAKCNVETWTGSWDRMRTSVKMGNANKVCGLVNSIVPMFTNNPNIP